MKQDGKHNSGFTLIEILVALAIGSIVLAGVVQVFLGSKQAETLSMSLARIQENGRFAMEVINKDLRLTGYQGCANPSVVFIQGPNIQTNNWSVTDYTNQPISGGTVPAGGGIVSLFGGAINIADAVEKTDIVSVTYASSTYKHLQSDMTGTSSPIVAQNVVLDDQAYPSYDVHNVATNKIDFAATDILLITNCGNAHIFEASSVSGTDPITITHDGAANSSPSFGATNYLIGSYVHKLSQFTYYIKENPRKIRALYRRSISGTTDELIEGVENLKVLYGHYDDNDTNPSNDDEVSWVDADTINSTASLDWANVTSVKVALLMTDETEVLLSTGPASYDLLGTTIAPISTDRKMRRVFSTSAKFRNRDGKRISQ